jgi:broad specificity phosphatase PhoE
MPIRSQDAFDALLHQLNRSFRLNQPQSVTRFFIVRHGESIANKEGYLAGQTLDADLTPEGVQMAHDLGRRLKAERHTFSAIYSSPMLRAKKTTACMLHELEIDHPILEDPRLHERHTGKFDGKKLEGTFLEIRRGIEKQIESLNTFAEKFAYKLDPQDEKEEALQTVSLRAKDFLFEKHQFHKGQQLLIGCHGTLMKSLLMADLAHHHQADLEHHRFVLPNCTLMIIDVVDEDLKVVHCQGLIYRDTSQV